MEMTMATESPSSDVGELLFVAGESSSSSASGAADMSFDIQAHLEQLLDATRDPMVTDTTTNRTFGPIAASPYHAKYRKYLQNTTILNGDDDGDFTIDDDVTMEMTTAVPATIAEESATTDTSLRTYSPTTLATATVTAAPGKIIGSRFLSLLRSQTTAKPDTCSNYKSDLSKLLYLFIL